MPGDGIPQPAVTLFGAVAMKTFSGAHLIDGCFHRFATGLGERFRDVANAKANQSCVWVGGSECLHTASDLREEISRFEFEVIAVDLDHRKTEFLRASCYIR